MSVEIYYALKDDAVPVTLEEAQARFADAGVPCTIEPEETDMHWLVFEPRGTDILVSTKDNKLVFATIHASITDDDPEFIEKLNSVLESMGFSAGEDDEDY